jgi:hypothetical protein
MQQQSCPSIAPFCSSPSPAIATTDELQAKEDTSEIQREILQREILQMQLQLQQLQQQQQNPVQRFCSSLPPLGSNVPLSSYILQQVVYYSEP